MKRSFIIWTSASVLLCLLLGVIVFPKVVYEPLDERVVRECECFGSEFWFGTRCVGFPYDCQEVVISDWQDPCEELSCTDIFNQLILDGSANNQLFRNEGTDVLLVIDSSYSMEGDKLLAAKQAAQRLVSDLKDDERIGIISFSENASVVHDFSNDKKSLSQGIMGITVSGGTNYLPALESVGSLFAQESRQSKKGLIFLTDGNPSDERDPIIAKARLLAAKDIELFAVSFGIDEQTHILEEMIRATSSEEEFSERYKSFSDAEGIIDAFYEAWQGIANLELISFSGVDDNVSIKQDQMSLMSFEVFLDNTKLSKVSFDEAMCIPHLDVSVLAVQGNSSFEVPLRQESDKFFFSEVLSSGSYDLRMSGSFRSNHNGSCFFSGEQVINNFTISNASASCELLGCDQSKESLEDFDLAINHEVDLPRDAGFGRVVILADTSESMRLYLSELARGVDRLNRLFSIGDERALISFSDEARLLVPLTRDKDEVSRALGEIIPQGTTKVVPALRKASFVLKKDRTDHDVVVIFTDGLNYDVGGEQEIVTNAYGLVNEGVCVYVFGYGRELVNNPSSDDLFRKITSYSSRKTGCGKYAYAPNARELSSVVTDMFGGSRPGDEYLRIIVDREDQSSAGSLLFDVRVVSMKTGIQLPFVAYDGCVAYPSASFVLKKGKKVFDVQVEQLIDGSFKVLTPYLLPGKYSLVVSASLPIDGCDVVAEHVEEFVLIGPPADTSEGVVTLVILLLAAGLIVISRELMRK